ncbi:MAG: peptidoglycan DD-metalloendopeptidase family protein [Candidatus Liptonbacteria bacterium]
MGAQLIAPGGEDSVFLLAQPTVEFSPYPSVDKAFIAAESMKNQGSLCGAPDLISHSSGMGGVISYEVKTGDTLAGIASAYGLTTQTLISSNPALKRSKSLRAGQELKILPVSGTLHRVSEGEDLDSISRLYNVSEDNLREFNSGIELNNLLGGVSLVVPGASASQNSNSHSNSNSISGYFRLPADGLNWGTLHGKNAVDIANTCGTDIFAAAEGLVTETNSLGWSNGYGSYIAIEHPIGIKTKYAHLEKLRVDVGDYVRQGDVIGDMGQTGDATGCHLHFEVGGTENPFVK